MRLYHGTNTVFDKIDLNKSRISKDFGRGFYLSAEKQQALDMANQKCLQTGGSPHVQGYDFDEAHLTGGSLKVLRFDAYSEDWVHFILMNRNNKTQQPCHDYDVVIGPIANDNIGVQLFRFHRNYIDIPTLIKKLRYKHLTIQYFFGTEKAIKLLQRHD